MLLCLWNPFSFCSQGTSLPFTSRRCYPEQLCGTLTMLWRIYFVVSVSCLHCSFSDGSGRQKADIWFLRQLGRNVPDTWYYSGLQVRIKSAGIRLCNYPNICLVLNKRESRRPDCSVVWLCSYQLHWQKGQIFGVIFVKSMGAACWIQWSQGSIPSRFSVARLLPRFLIPQHSIPYHGQSEKEAAGMSCTR